MIAGWLCASRKGDKMTGCGAGQSARDAEVHGWGVQVTMVQVTMVQATWIPGKVLQSVTGRQASGKLFVDKPARTHNGEQAQNGARPLNLVAAKNLRREERVVTSS